LSSINRSLTIEVCARYLPAADETSIGGDWYDVLRLSADEVGLVIGDTVGHGLEAITAMGQLRSALSALTYFGRPPAETLEALEQFALTVPDALVATCVYARVDLARRHVVYSTAGHMPLCLLVPGEPGPRLLDGTQDLPLAVGLGPPRRNATVELPPGATLLLYSDGLVERRDEGLDQGLARLVDTLAAVKDLPVDELCPRLVEALVPRGSQRDDVALVAARFP
jgi:serine phosphatase RsbU (regulator of sigma subunit)